MKIKLVLLNLLLLLCFQSFGQRVKFDTAKFDVADCKMQLTKFLLSTHSLTMLSLDENDPRIKLYLRETAATHLLYVENNFTKLKKYTEIDPDLNKTLVMMIKVYGDLLVYSRGLRESFFVKALLESTYKLKILPGLWGNK